LMKCCIVWLRVRKGGVVCHLKMAHHAAGIRQENKINAKKCTLTASFEIQ
jgi:hypothetical protein